MNRWVKFGLLSLGYLAVTTVVGWWGLAAVGVVTGYVVGARSRAGWISAGAAATGSALLLVWNATSGPAVELAELVGGALGVPGVVLVVLTLGFAATVAGLSASLVARGVDHVRRGAERDPRPSNA